MAASIVIALVVGVAIDDSIVFIWALSKATKNPEMSSPTQAVLAAVRCDGVACSRHDSVLRRVQEVS